MTSFRDPAQDQAEGRLPRLFVDYATEVWVALDSVVFSDWEVHELPDDAIVVERDLPGVVRDQGRTSTVEALRDELKKAIECGHLAIPSEYPYCETEFLYLEPERFRWTHWDHL